MAGISGVYHSACSITVLQHLSRDLYRDKPQDMSAEGKKEPDKIVPVRFQYYVQQDHLGHLSARGGLFLYCFHPLFCEFVTFHADSPFVFVNLPH